MVVYAVDPMSSFFIVYFLFHASYMYIDEVVENSLSLSL